MFPEVRGECEELNNYPQISAAAAAGGRPLTIYTSNSRREIEKKWRLQGQGKSAVCKRG